MTVVRQEQFTRLLRWYPQAWRDRNGAMLLGTMLDEAEREGRTAPSTVERWSVILHGLGTRLDARLALWFALGGLVLAAAGRVASTWGSIPLAEAGAVWLLSLFTVAVCPGFVAVAAVALLRHLGLVSEPRSLALLGLMLPALALAGLTYVSYGLAFVAANDGVPRSGLAAAWPWLFAVACAVGGAAIGVLIHGLLQRARLHHAARVGVATLAGVVLAPALGLSLTTAYVAAIVAVAVALLTLVPRVANRSVARDAAAKQSRARGEDAALPRTRALARALAVLAATGSTVGVIFALTGARWFSVGTADPTAVMGQGITIALVSALPLLAAIGVLIAAHARHRAARTWGPLLLAALSLMAVGIAYLNAPAWEGMAPGFALGSALGGAAVAWWMIPRVRGSVRARAAIGVLIGVGYAAFLGMLLAPLLAFVVPIAAVTFAIWGPRRTHSATPRSPRPGSAAAVPSAS